MSDYRAVSCPKCKKKLPGTYRADLSNKQKSHGHCAFCGEEYTVIHGENSVRIVKGYA